VEKSVGPGSAVIRVRRPGGGTASAVHALDVRGPNSAVMQLALRRYLLFSELEEVPDAAEREARNLQLVERAGIAAPRLVAVDADGAECDVPAVLMTRLRGHLDLQPRDIDLWLRRMAELLPPIHAIDPGDGQVPEWTLWNDLRGAQPPEWSRKASDWEALIDIVRGPWPRYVSHFVHRDFQHYNVLWSRGPPTGVVDWASACMGPVELDFGHFRHNLLGDFGFDVAERFAERGAMDAYVASLIAKLR
jgi:aminoglycoside phosphotransferase (APT) family kinase protein